MKPDPVDSGAQVQPTPSSQRGKESPGGTCTPPSPCGQGTSTGPGPCRSTGTGTWTLKPRLAPCAAAAAAALSCGSSAAAAAEDGESGWSASSREMPKKLPILRKKPIGGEAPSRSDGGAVG